MADKSKGGVAFKSTVKGAQASRGLHAQTVKIGDQDFALNTTMSMLADQEAIFYDVSQDPSLVGAREGQPLGEIHETMIAFYALVYKQAKQAELTPYSLSELVGLDQMQGFVAQMNSLIGQLPGAEGGNEATGETDS